MLEQLVTLKSTVPVGSYGSPGTVVWTAGWSCCGWWIISTYLCLVCGYYASIHAIFFGLSLLHSFSVCPLCHINCCWVNWCAFVMAHIVVWYTYMCKSNTVGPGLSEQYDWLFYWTNLTPSVCSIGVVCVLLEYLITTWYISKWASLIRTNSLIWTLLWYKWHKGVQVLLYY